MQKSTIMVQLIILVATFRTGDHYLRKTVRPFEHMWFRFGHLIHQNGFSSWEWVQKCAYTPSRQTQMWSLGKEVGWDALLWASTFAQKQKQLHEVALEVSVRVGSAGRRFSKNASSRRPRASNLAKARNPRNWIRHKNGSSKKEKWGSQTSLGALK